MGIRAPNPNDGITEFTEYTLGVRKLLTDNGFVLDQPFEVYKGINSFYDLFIQDGDDIKTID